jgi:hypothetical protein
VATTPGGGRCAPVRATIMRGARHAERPGDSRHCGDRQFSVSAEKRSFARLKIICCPPTSRISVVPLTPRMVAPPDAGGLKPLPVRVGGRVAHARGAGCVTAAPQDRDVGGAGRTAHGGEHPVGADQHAVPDRPVRDDSGRRRRALFGPGAAGLQRVSGAGRPVRRRVVRRARVSIVPGEGRSEQCHDDEDRAGGERDPHLSRRSVIHLPAFLSRDRLASRRATMAAIASAGRAREC